MESDYRIVYFPMEEKFSIWRDNKLIKEWFNSRSDAEIWISENITEKTMNKAITLQEVIDKLKEYNKWTIEDSFPADDLDGLNEYSECTSIANNLPVEIYNAIIQEINEKLLKGTQATESDYIACVGKVYKNLITY